LISYSQLQTHEIWVQKWCESREVAYIINYCGMSKL
jgi:hypothetical protein